MMKSIKALMVLGLLSIGSSALAYRWGFTNVTNKVLVIKLSLAGTDADFYNIVQPGRRTEFDWGWGNARAGFCLSNIIVGEYSPNISVNFPGTNSGQLPRDSRNARFFDDSRITRAIDDRGPWFYALGRQPLRQPKVVFLQDQAWGKFNDQIDKAVEKLTSGIAKTAEEAAKMAGYDLGGLLQSAGGIVQSIIDLVRTGKCVSREFDMIEKNGAITLYTKQ